MKVGEIPAVEDGRHAGKFVDEPAHGIAAL